MKLKSGLIRGEGKRKQALRRDPLFNKTREVFKRDGIVFWDNKPQERKGQGNTIQVGLLTTNLDIVGKSAKKEAKRRNLPDNIDGIPIFYEWSSEIKLAAWETQNYFWTRPDDTDRNAFLNEPYTADTDVQTLRKYQNPMYAGVEVFAESRHRHSMRGATLSTIVYDVTTGTPLLLSCAHVLAQSAFFGSGYGLPVETVGMPIYQPRYPDLAGNLLRWGTSDDPSDINIDAAVATIASGRSVTDGYYGSYGSIVKAAADDPVAKESVIQTGRSSGRTSGTIVSTSSSINILGIDFADVFTTGSMGQSGDSGSLLLRNSGAYNPLGIYFAYSAGSSYYIKATLIEEDLGVTFLAPPSEGGLLRINMNAQMQSLSGGIYG